jgi:hypothetical protein
LLFQRFNHKHLITILILAYLCVQCYCIPRLSVNYDEGSFAGYGVTILKLHGNKDVVKYESKLPITALNMLPRAVEQVFRPGLSKPDGVSDIIKGRYISLLATLLLSLVIYHWTSLLYGKKPALYSFIIFLLCPNFLAHGIFVSSDIFACLFMTLSFYYFWKFGQTNKVKDFVLSCIFVGLAQVSKFSMIHLFILFPLLFILKYAFRNKAGWSPKFRLAGSIKLILLFVFVNWFIICVAHLFYGMFIPLNHYQFSSATFQKLQSVFHFAGEWLPVPFPSSYIKSMDAVMYYDHLGGGVPGSLNGPPYILGESSAHGFWYYYFVVLFYKLPVSLLLLLFTTCMVYLRNRGSGKFMQNEMYLLIPSLYFLLYMNFFYSTQVGIRHIMIILPLLYIFFGFFFSRAQSVTGRYFGYVLVAYQFISVGLYFPHFLPYTNEFIPNKKMAYKKIGDTNICYGEGQQFLLQYLFKNPDAKYLPGTIQPGKIVMEVNEMQDLDIKTMGKYDWVRPLTPVDHIHSQYLVFEISTATADSLQKKRPL